VATKPIVIEIVGDSKKFNKSVDKIDTKMGKLGGSVKKLGGLFAGAFAVRKIVDFAGEASRLAEEADAINASTEALIESTGGAANVTADEVQRLSDVLQEFLHVSDDTIQEGSNLLLTFTNIKNEVGEGNDIFNRATATVQNMAAAFETDGKSAAIQLGKALNDPIAGITALSRSGIQFTEDQKDMIKQMVESGDILGAQKIILDELAVQTEGAAAASATAADKMKIAWDDAKEEIGRSLNEILVPLMDWVANELPGWTERFKDGLSKIDDAMRDFANSDTGTKIREYFQGIADGVSESWDPFWARFGRGLERIGGWLDAFEEKVQRWWASFQRGWTDFAAGLDVVWGQILEAVEAFIDGWDSVYSFFEFFINALMDFWQTVDRVKNYLVESFMRLPGDLASAAAGMWNFISEGFRASINYVIDMWNGLRFRTPDIPLVPGDQSMDIGVPQIPRLAEGGIVTRPTLAVIGEAGPEAVIPLSSSRNAPGVAGGVTINQTIYAQDDIELGLEKAQRKMAIELAGLR